MTGPIEVEAFAEHLRNLKDRTGLSYGALAAKLHVGRSTLHRYCLGETVPVDYALVNRLARLAGAPREELLELHRQWVLADEARTRAVRPVAPGPAPEPAPAPAAEPEPPRDAESVATEPVANERGATGPVSEPVVSQTASEPVVSQPVVSEPASEPVVSEPGTAEPVVAVTGGGRGRGPERSARIARARWTVAAGAAAALVAAVVAVDLADGGSGAGPSEARAPVTAPAPPGTASTSASATAAPTPTPSGGAPAGPSATPPSPRPSASSPASSVTGATPAWSADSHVWAQGCDHRYLVNRPPSAVPPPPVEQDARPWAASLGAVHGGTTIVRATITAPRGETVVVQRLSVRVAARRAPLSWPAYAMDNGCGGMLTPAAYTVDLDAARPLARPVDGFDGERPLPATRLPYRVTDGDPLVVRVEATAGRCDCDWYLEAEWTSGDRRGTLTVDDGGRPFRTSGYPAAEEYGYAVENGAWGR
ncbi:helix-turn-helix domain-containing protein [Streptomyces sp. NPDC047928]|uniref:helix-turn-helix domain-containing protein n=1 Tax=unclassified Streptomyces TaxID=2593676 RepID=UPI00371E9668